MKVNLYSNEMTLSYNKKTTKVQEINFKTASDARFLHKTHQRRSIEKLKYQNKHDFEEQYMKIQNIKQTAKLKLRLNYAWD